MNAAVQHPVVVDLDAYRPTVPLPQLPARPPAPITAVTPLARARTVARRIARSAFADDLRRHQYQLGVITGLLLAIALISGGIYLDATTGGTP